MEYFGFESGIMPVELEAAGDAAWYVSSADSNSGTYAARSGAIPDGATSVMRRTVTIGASGGTVLFAWKVGTESGWDFLRFKVDGATVAQITGTTSWALQFATLAAGERVLEWSYEKDPIITVAPDTAWVDDIYIDGVGWAEVSAEALMVEIDTSAAHLSAAALVVELDTTGAEDSAEALVVEIDTRAGRAAAEALIVEVEARNVGRCAAAALVVEVDAVPARLDLRAFNDELRALVANVRALDTQLEALPATAAVTELRAVLARVLATRATVLGLRRVLDAADVLHARVGTDPAQAIRLWRWERAVRALLLRLDDRLRALIELLVELDGGRAGRTYAVRTGDTLQGIAATELGDWRRWRELLRADLPAGPLAPGTLILLPAEK